MKGLMPRRGEPGALGLARRVWAHGEQQSGGDEEDVSVGRRVGLEGPRTAGEVGLGDPAVG